MGQHCFWLLPCCEQRDKEESCWDRPLCYWTHNCITSQTLAPNSPNPCWDLRTCQAAVYVTIPQHLYTCKIVEGQMAKLKPQLYDYEFLQRFAERLILVVAPCNTQFCMTKTTRHDIKWHDDMIWPVFHTDTSLQAAPCGPQPKGGRWPQQRSGPERKRRPIAPKRMPRLAPPQVTTSDTRNSQEATAAFV